MQNENILIGGTSKRQVFLLSQMANRHGLIAGATGTGKTVTLQTLAEGFSRAGVPVFVSDIKGDLSGLARAGVSSDRLQSRINELALNEHQFRPYPTLFWDIYGQGGHPVRATISDLGPLLLANLLSLNPTQSGVLAACFKIADDQGLLLLDLKDLRAILSWIADNNKELQADYGSLPSQSIAAIQRALLVLEQQGADEFFGEPALELRDLMQVDFSGNGVVSVMDATRLMQSPKLYATFLLWLLAELFEQLPEAGDLDKPKLVLFFDEAHLLFDDAPKVLLDKVEQVVRLIRSKGVGVYFVSQNPMDIPSDILGQLGNRVQHALRAFTPADQKAVKAAAQTMRGNDGLDTEQAITELGVGEALVSVLDEQGRPTPVERVLIAPPGSRIGPLNDEERRSQVARSPLGSKYDTALDRESAYEILKQRSEQILPLEKSVKENKAPRRSKQSDTLIQSLAKSAARSIGSQLGRQIARGLLGSLLGGRR